MSTIRNSLTLIHRWTARGQWKGVGSYRGDDPGLNSCRREVGGQSADALGAPVAACSGCGERDGRTGHGKRPRGPGWRELAGTFSCPDDGSVAKGRRQEGSGRARSRAKALLNWFCQGQLWGKCRVRRRALRVCLPAREKNRRWRVLVVASCSPRPTRPVQRARLWAITWTASQAPFGKLRIGGEAPRGEMVQPDTVLQVADGILDLGVAAMVGLQFQGLPVPVGDEAVIAVVGEEGQLGTGRGLHPPDDEPHRRGAGLTLEGDIGGLRHIGGAVHPVATVFNVKRSNQLLPGSCHATGSHA